MSAERRGLSESDLQMLAFEAQAWSSRGAKEQAVRDLFDLTPTRYYQLLGQLIDRPEALAASPMVVGRLRRLREDRAARRSMTRRAS